MKKILIIEDDEKIALALSVRLKAHGYCAWIAGDGITALNLAMRQRPDLVVLDISLPAGNGFELAERFQTLPETRETPIIFATASKDPDLRKRAVRAGAAGLLRKPYNAEDLLALAQNALEEFPASVRSGIALRRDATTPPVLSSAPKRILIVEDDDKIANSLAVRLRAAGYQTSIAADGLSGVRSAAQQRPDLVLLDISLPAGDGFKVAERIQTHIPTPTPIIFLTASKRSEFRQRARDLGAVAFFEKPFEAQDLRALIRNGLTH